MRGIVLAALICFIANIYIQAQTTLIGGANINILEERPLTKLRYFGGIEFKIQLGERLKLYFTPQYQGLRVEDYQLRSVAMPVGLSYAFNPLWDEKTPLIRLVDVNIGAVGVYNFEAAYLHNGEEPKNISSYNAGVRVSTKFRLFIFCPFFVSYTYGLGQYFLDDVKEEQYLQTGIYLPVSHFFKYY